MPPANPRLWCGTARRFGMPGGTLIGRFDAASEQMSTYPLESKTADRIATDGLKNIWFGSQGGTELGVLQSDSGQISTRSMAAVVENLYWLAVGTDQVWMSDSESKFIYAFSLTPSGELSLSISLDSQADHLLASLSLASLPVFH